MNNFVSLKYLEIKNVSKYFKNENKKNLVLKNINLNIAKGEFFTILGPSGCGKTTLLKIIAGLEEPDVGKIFLENKDITKIPPNQRPLNIMFQSYALFPHMDVFSNISFGLIQEGLKEEEIFRRVDKITELLKIKNLFKRYPESLSGGQQQRVALARVLVKKPRVLLLDEPFAALDKELRKIMRLELVSIQEELQITFVLVTHNQGEAMTIANNIAVMNMGEIVQIGSPNEIYEKPNSAYVANFIGDTNLFEAKIIERKNELITVYIKEIMINIKIVLSPENNLVVGDKVWVSLRPEKIKISREKEKTENCFKGIVHDLVYLGHTSIYHVRLEGGKVIKVSQSNMYRMIKNEITWDSKVYISWSRCASVVIKKKYE